MSWLNFNDSINSLKGQISNFASNVLAEDEGKEISESEFKELKELCQKQELEITKLRTLTDELKTNQRHLEDDPIGSWNWEAGDQIDSKLPNETISALKKNVSVLESEKAELLVQLEQLDADNQENLLNIMKMKEKLQFELNDLNEKYLKVKQENKVLVSKEEQLLDENKKLKEDGVKDQNLSSINQEIEELKKELCAVKKSNENLIQESKKTEEIENEKKLLYSELKKANERITFLEKKDLEDEDITQKVDFAHETEVSSLKNKLEELTNNYEHCQNQQKEIENLYNNLKTEHENLEKKYENEVTTLQEEINKLESREKETDQIDETEQFKDEIKDLRQLNEELLIKASGRMDKDLEEELETIQQEHEVQLNVLREELEQLKNQESKNVTDSEKFEKLEEQKLEVGRELEDLKQQIDFLQENHKVTLHELHNKYINIITENIKKFQECDKPSDFQNCIHDDDPQVAELSKHIENIIKILLDLKWKCSDLEKKVLEISEEKNTIVAEKNHEIEKLIQNSDMLSQEIVAKNRTIKEYETECNEIAKNNEVLITELETIKNNPTLQTISESNEDSVIFLESQLETANKRIEDLEKIIDDLEKEKQQPKQEANISDNLDLEIALEHLNKTETEVCNKKKDYDDLLNSFDQLQINYESLKNELDESKRDFFYSNEKNAELQSTLEKLKSDYENLEYQVSELHINYETIKEETDDCKLKFKTLLSENSSLKVENAETIKKWMNFESQCNSLNEKLSAEEINKRNVETQIETLTEKLKNCKMTETTLKLQLEQKNKELAAQTEARYNLEVSLNKLNADLSEFQNNFEELLNQNDKLHLQIEKLEEMSSKKDDKIKELEYLVKEQQKLEKTDEIEGKIEVLNNKVEDHNNLKRILDETVLEKANLQAELNKLAQVQAQLKDATNNGAILHQQLQEVTNSRNELINMVTMKHQENVTYHNEIQRLNQVVITEVEKYKNLETQFKELQSKASSEDSEEKNKQIEKLTDQNNFLKEKCEVLAKNLLEEQSQLQKLILERSVPSEKEITLQKNLDRLQSHLIELEEHYTEELFQAEQKNQALKTKMTEIEEREKSSSTMYTSVSIRANQQVESLQSQLQTVIQERDSLRKQISDAEDENTKQAAALANLQFVLEQFRKDKEKDVLKETERIRRHIHVEKQVQEELRMDISNLKAQLEERNQGLLAASRLSDQLESSKKTISGLKEEVSQLQSKLSKSEDDLKNALSTNDGKVDKLLIKNLILGYVTSNNAMNRDQTQILKIIATVLDFNQQDHDKVKLNKPQQGWLASFLAPQPDMQNKMTEDSLSKAFIKFLENESRPLVVPSLLNNTESSTKTTNSSRSTTPGPGPIVLSEIVLPTFSDFAQNRNSSSILKDVLKDNS